MNINLPWSAHENYNICIVSNDEDALKIIEKEFKNSKVKGKFISTDCYSVPAPKDWVKIWQKISKAIEDNNLSDLQIAVMGEDINERAEINPYLETVEAIEVVAKNIWLSKALSEDRVEPHFQSIVDRKGDIFGYEAFVRITPDSEEKSGGQIITASYDLKIQHLVDKHLHRLAIEKFAKAGLKGSLFINFMTGFIQLPERYLEKLTDAARNHNILPKSLALDVSKTEDIQDIMQIASIAEFCNSKGYAVALDDVSSVEMLQNILNKTTPDFIKIDRDLTRNIAQSTNLHTVKEIIEISHAKGCMVLAEGIEEEETSKALNRLGVDLFQGYLYSKPVPANKAG